MTTGGGDGLGGGGVQNAEVHESTRHVSKEVTLKGDPLAQPCLLVACGSETNHLDKPSLNS